jgi:hypothetical protein
MYYQANMLGIKDEFDDFRDFRVKFSKTFTGFMAKRLGPVSDPQHCTVKKVIDFPVPGRDVTDQTLQVREKLNYSRPGRVWSVSSRLETGKPMTFFYSVKASKNY